MNGYDSYEIFALSTWLPLKHRYGYSIDFLPIHSRFSTHQPSFHWIQSLCTHRWIKRIKLLNSRHVLTHYSNLVRNDIGGAAHVFVFFQGTRGGIGGFRNRQFQVVPLIGLTHLMSFRVDIWGHMQIHMWIHNNTYGTLKIKNGRSNSKWLWHLWVPSASNVKSPFHTAKNDVNDEFPICRWFSHYPYAPCMQYLPTFALKINQFCRWKYTIHGAYGL